MDTKLAETIGVEAYTYLYPLVLMDLTRAQMTNVGTAGEAVGRGPVDTFAHVRTFPPAEFKDVVKPNFDTLYSVAWLDLSAEPRIITLPDAGDLYYLLPLYDMWTDIFAVPGTRTTGNGAGHFVVCGPGWSGELPDGVRRVDAPTPLVWIIGRTRASTATYPAANAFQDGMAITPLSAWPGPPPAVRGTVDPAVDDTTPPLRQVFALTAEQFFDRAAELLTIHPPHANDYPIRHRMARLGLITGEPFHLTKADSSVQDALTAAVPIAQQKIIGFQHRIGRKVNGWQMNTETMGAWGTDYLKRATVDLLGLGANLPEDAIYPIAYLDADTHPLTGANDYLLRFHADEIPPAQAFWSLTLYDQEGFQVPNPLQRFALGDRDPLTFGDDGTLDLHIQHESPGPDKESNWLPAPDGPFNLTLRLYYPEATALDGTWAPPAVRKNI
ncbi:MAG: hypothetical protein JWP64_2185 [Pseudonocardia sp.]|jgi:hypothetical protein|uniref:DUF1254 domain-containing protein n=1 Tax=Pseudonocardia sp. TaxID=60912 RepID=UPI00262C1E6D|nr:DUF1254 domain-containing protein [Pseudonocardia sp.]MCU1627236.1 hypothetical protein [Pseudonocardia sp.]